MVQNDVSKNRTFQKCKAELIRGGAAVTFAFDSAMPKRQRSHIILLKFHSKLDTKKRFEFMEGRQSLLDGFDAHIPVGTVEIYKVPTSVNTNENSTQTAS